MDIDSSISYFYYFKKAYDDSYSFSDYLFFYSFILIIDYFFLSVLNWIWNYDPRSYLI